MEWLDTNPESLPIHTQKSPIHPYPHYSSSNISISFTVPEDTEVTFSPKKKSHTPPANKSLPPSIIPSSSSLSLPFDPLPTSPWNVMGEKNKKFFTEDFSIADRPFPTFSSPPINYSPNYPSQPPPPPYSSSSGERESDKCPSSRLEEQSTTRNPLKGADKKEWRAEPLASVSIDMDKGIDAIHSMRKRIQEQISMMDASLNAVKQSPPKPVNEANWLRSSPLLPATERMREDNFIDSNLVFLQHPERDTRTTEAILRGELKDLQKYEEEQRNKERGERGSLVRDSERGSHVRDSERGNLVKDSERGSLVRDSEKVSLVRASEKGGEDQRILERDSDLNRVLFDNKSVIENLSKTISQFSTSRYTGKGATCVSSISEKEIGLFSHPEMLSKNISLLSDDVNNDKVFHSRVVSSLSQRYNELLQESGLEAEAPSYRVMGSSRASKDFLESREAQERERRTEGEGKEEVSGGSKPAIIAHYESVGALNQREKERGTSVRRLDERREAEAGQIVAVVEEKDTGRVVSETDNEEERRRKEEKGKEERKGEERKKEEGNNFDDIMRRLNENLMSVNERIHNEIATSVSKIEECADKPPLKKIITLREEYCPKSEEKTLMSAPPPMKCAPFPFSGSASSSQGMAPAPQTPSTLQQRVRQSLSGTQPRMSDNVVIPSLDNCSSRVNALFSTTSSSDSVRKSVSGRSSTSDREKGAELKERQSLNIRHSLPQERVTGDSTSKPEPRADQGTDRSPIHNVLGVLDNLLLKEEPPSQSRPPVPLEWTLANSTSSPFFSSSAFTFSNLSDNYSSSGFHLENGRTEGTHLQMQNGGVRIVNASEGSEGEERNGNRWNFEGRRSNTGDHRNLQMEERRRTDDSKTLLFSSVHFSDRNVQHDTTTIERNDSQACSPPLRPRVDDTDTERRSIFVESITFGNSSLNGERMGDEGRRRDSEGEQRGPQERATLEQNTLGNNEVENTVGYDEESECSSRFGEETKDIRIKNVFREDKNEEKDAHQALGNEALYSNNQGARKNTAVEPVHYSPDSLRNSIRSPASPVLSSLLGSNLSSSPPFSQPSLPARQLPAFGDSFNSNLATISLPITTASSLENAPSNVTLPDQASVPSMSLSLLFKERALPSQDAACGMSAEECSLAVLYEIRQKLEGKASFQAMLSKGKSSEWIKTEAKRIAQLEAVKRKIQSIIYENDSSTGHFPSTTGRFSEAIDMLLNTQGGKSVSLAGPLFALEAIVSDVIEQRKEKLSIMQLIFQDLLEEPGFDLEWNKYFRNSSFTPNNLTLLESEPKSTSLSPLRPSSLFSESAQAQPTTEWTAFLEECRTSNNPFQFPWNSKDKYFLANPASPQNFITLPTSEPLDATGKATGNKYEKTLSRDSELEQNNRVSASSSTNPFLLGFPHKTFSVERPSLKRRHTFTEEESQDTLSSLADEDMPSTVRTSMRSNQAPSPRQTVRLMNPKEYEAFIAIMRKSEEGLSKTVGGNPTSALREEGKKQAKKVESGEEERNGKSGEDHLLVKKNGRRLIMQRGSDSRVGKEGSANARDMTPMRSSARASSYQTTPGGLLNPRLSGVMNEGEGRKSEKVLMKKLIGLDQKVKSIIDNRHSLPAGVRSSSVRGGSVKSIERSS